MEATQALSTQLDYQRDEHRVHLVVYHLIWCPKRRKSVLVGDSKQRCQQIIEQKCLEKGWAILELAIQPDHIPLFIRVWPMDSVASAGEGDHLFSVAERISRPGFSKLPCLWTRSYFASTAGAVKPFNGILQHRKEYKR